MIARPHVNVDSATSVAIEIVTVRVDNGRGRGTGGERSTSKVRRLLVHHLRLKGALYLVGCVRLILVRRSCIQGSSISIGGLSVES